MNRREHGAINGLVVIVVVLVLLLFGAGGFGVWAYMNYTDQKNNVDAKVSAAVATAKKDQQAADAKTFAEQEKLPNRQFVGPDDYGRVTFNYPKTWNVYLAHDGSNNSNYEAMFAPVMVTAPTSSSAYPVHLVISNHSYEQTLQGYQQQIAGGSLKATPITINGQTGLRLDGQLSQNTKGSMVIFKIRDKTLMVATEVTSFADDFNNIVVSSIKFNS